MDNLHALGLPVLASAVFLLCPPSFLLAQSPARPELSAAGASTSGLKAKGDPIDEGKAKGHKIKGDKTDTGRAGNRDQEVHATRSSVEDSPKSKVLAVALPLGLIKVNGGNVRLGISAKDLEEIATKFGKTEHLRNRYRRWLLRELGDEKRTVQPFYLGKHEVTNRQYYIFIKQTWPAHRFPFSWWKPEDINKWRDLAHAKWEARKKAGQRVPPFEFNTLSYWDQNWARLEWALPKEIADKPVGYVGYSDARAFCIWAGLRLPTQSEWQLAFDGERYTWGKDWKPTVAVDHKVVQVGKGAFGPNKLGFTEMMGNVWEWVDSRFEPLQGYNSAYAHARKIWRKKRVDIKQLQTPLFGDQRIILGGCADNWGQAPVAYRRQNRMPLGGANRAEAVGFRVAKSITPAFDATTLRYRYDYNKDLLLGRELDVPSIRDRKAMRSIGLHKDFRIRGGERWDLVDGLIHGYHMVSLLSVKAIKPHEEIQPRNEKIWKIWSAKFGTTGKHGAPLAAIFSTEKLWFDTRDIKGTKGKLSLPPGMYTIYFRGKGLPDELRYAMLAGGIELHRNKGKRESKEDKQRWIDTQKKEAAKKAKLDKKKKLRKKRRGRRYKQATNETEQIKNAMATWAQVVDSYAVPDKVSRGFPKKKRPKLIRIQPGNLFIPIDRAVLLIRNQKGDYLGWIPVPEKIKLKRRGETQLSTDPKTGAIDYKSFLKFDARQVLSFEFQFHISPEEMTKPWTFQS